MKIDVAKKGESTILTFSGMVDESAVFSPVDLQGSKTVIFVLSGIKLINSCGIREWIKWLNTFPQDAKIVLAHCPRIVVDQINMVDGFLPKNGAVLSFFVPYYCNACGEETTLLFTNGKEFTGANISAPPTAKCAKCGQTAELDVMESKYFKFITKVAAA